MEKVANNADDDSSMEVAIGKEENAKVESSAVTTNAPGKEDNPYDNSFAKLPIPDGKKESKEKSSDEYSISHGKEENLDNESFSKATIAHENINDTRSVESTTTFDKEEDVAPNFREASTLAFLSSLLVILSF